ncbi:MAG: carboxylate--amine ligase, partial [Eubacteriales bacterium]|nr:carboxylate--amine ligase [Eubacteriales bacterium]
MNSINIVPVLLGADLNSYSVARAFSEYCNAKSYAFGKYPLGATNHSNIVNFILEKGLSDDGVTVPLLIAFAKEHVGDELYLFGCTDEYAEMIIRNRDALSKYYFCPCVTAETARTLGTKESFYSMCEKHGIPYPKTYILRPDNKADSLSEEILGFSYPVIIKPSHSSSYWKHPFDGMKKVYCAKNEAEAKEIAGKIFGAGYSESLVIQDMIPGGDDRMYVLTCYSGTDGKVKKACLGHVLLEEHTPKGLGNHTAVITENHPEITDVLIKFLDGIGYMGFSNFDIKYDVRDGKFKVFEVNLRQGRSNYY